MSGRALIAIGCNEYDHLNPLNCAEADAASLFNILMRPDVGDYDNDRSCVLLSPTLETVRTVLAAILFESGNIDTLTVTFAGHGALSGGSFYMAMKDSRVQGLSATALSLADLFRMIAEAAPRQTYLILDACQAGGLIADLNVMLKPDVMGEFGTPGVSLLAMAASNEIAVEEGGHGIGTAALLSCIRGDVFLQDSNPALDLVEIGRAISKRVSAAGMQNPVVWGLNLFGPAGFCKNPHAGSGNAPLRSVLIGWPDVSTTDAVRDGLPKLWEPYVSIPTRWEPRKFLDRLSPLVSGLKSNPSVMIDFSHRVTEAFRVRARDSRDIFREIEVSATCAVAMLPFTDDPIVDSYLALCCRDIGLMVESAIGCVVDSTSAYEYALITGGMADLYYLPIRLSKLLGWAGYAVHARSAFGIDLSPASIKLTELFDKTFETYSLALVAMADSQAPYVLSVLTAAAHVNLRDHGERLIGHLFTSAIDCAGRVSRADLDASQTLSYLISRHSNAAKLRVELVAQPTELVAAIIRLSHFYKLDDEVDGSLSRLDHLTVNGYFPDDYLGFSEEQIVGGTNALFRIGHDFWRASELEAAWPPVAKPESSAQAMTSLLACLIFPDRSPWFLLP